MTTQTAELERLAAQRRREAAQAELDLRVARRVDETGDTEEEVRRQFADRAERRLRRAVGDYGRGARLITRGREEQRRAVAAARDAGAELDRMGYEVAAPSTPVAGELFAEADLLSPGVLVEHD